jgi:EmrB/QacA subfamily drug resistance transporter
LPAHRAVRPEGVLTSLRDEPAGLGRRAAAQENFEQTRYAWRVLSVTSLGVLLTGVNTSSLDVALPSVARHFDASPTAASWTLLSYMLVMTILILAFGRLADMVGRRRLYLLGLGVLTLASLGCALSPTVGWLIGFRALQAVGAAAIITNTTAQLTDAFPARLLTTGLSLNVAIAAAAQVVGPVVGGITAGAWGWRWVFAINVPIGLAGLAWASVTLRRTAAPPRTERFDLGGALLSFVVLGGITVALSFGGAHGWTDPRVLTAAAASLVSLPLFLLLQRRRRDPLVDLALFADRERAAAYLSTFLLAIARFAVVLLAALFLQAVQGLDPAGAGVRVLPVAAGLSIASPVAGRLAARFPARTVSSAGMLITAAGLAALAVLVSPHVGYPALAVALLAVGVGSGIFMTPNTASIMRSVRPDQRGVANGVRSMLQNTGYAVSTALSLALVTRPLSPDQQRAAYAGTLARLPGGDLAAFIGGYRVAFIVLLSLCLVGAVASLARGSSPPLSHPERAADLG